LPDDTAAHLLLDFNAQAPEGTITGNGKKGVSFVIQGEQNKECIRLSDGPVAMDCNNVKSATLDRPITRSKSPLKATVNTEESPKPSRQRNIIAKLVADSPRSLTRFATAEAKAKALNAEIPSGPAAKLQDSMNRNLQLQFSRSVSVLETLAKRNREHHMEASPSLDLGLDDPSNQETEVVCKKTDVPDTVQEELVVISSNEDSGDSLDKIYARIEMPTTTPAKGKEPVVQDALLTSGGSNSCTPIPEPHKKRIVKPSQNQKSPFLGCSKKETASKFANEVYDRVCSYGGETKDEINKSKIIDDGKYFINVRELADSVRPGGWLSNSTCEMAIRVLAPELAKQKKHVMPLILAVSIQY
jgi:hypothetical protein